MLIEKRVLGVGDYGCECEQENSFELQNHLLTVFCEAIANKVSRLEEKVDLLAKHQGVEFEVVAPKASELIIKKVEVTE